MLEITRTLWSFWFFSVFWWLFMAHLFVTSGGGVTCLILKNLQQSNMCQWSSLCTEPNIKKTTSQFCKRHRKTSLSGPFRWSCKVPHGGGGWIRVNHVLHKQKPQEKSKWKQRRSTGLQQYHQHQLNWSNNSSVKTLLNDLWKLTKPFSQQLTMFMVNILLPLVFFTTKKIVISTGFGVFSLLYY